MVPSCCWGLERCETVGEVVMGEYLAAALDCVSSCCVGRYCADDRFVLVLVLVPVAGRAYFCVL